MSQHTMQPYVLQTIDKAQQESIERIRPLLSDSESKSVLPTLDEILGIFAQKQLPQAIIAHSITVAYVAVCIAGWLKASCKCIKIDLPKLAAGALLHDIERLQPNHASRGADFVVGMGYPSLEPMIAVHMELIFLPGQALGEEAVLYLADKICQGSEIICLESRLVQCIQRYGDLPNIRRKFKTACMIRDRIVETIETTNILATEKILWETMMAKKM
ncbi:HD domain-containing protein [Anaerosinus massiliensis]|uniref:HD domain-containing protein n=1 Tax=Massilibacillus massiliensis TaxID=1806837 RepID=UPI000DA60CAD|nr:HD domain-containing protein [Massilibacillus massiliensis]